jgi:hypothetical protein
MLSSWEWDTRHEEKLRETWQSFVEGDERGRWMDVTRWVTAWAKMPQLLHYTHIIRTGQLQFLHARYPFLHANITPHECRVERSKFWMTSRAVFHLPPPPTGTQAV